MKKTLVVGCLTLLALLSVGCNGTAYGILQPNPEDLCKCLPIEPDIADFRHLAKHVPIPNIAAQEIGVDSILSWTQDAFVDPGAPRTGRELQVFHLATAFLQEASVNAADCDVHFDLSQSRNDLGTPPRDRDYPLKIVTYALFSLRTGEGPQRRDRAGA